MIHLILFSTMKKINFYWVIGNDACSYRGITEFSIFLEKDNCKFNTRWAALPVFEKQISRSRTHSEG